MLETGDFGGDKLSGLEFEVFRARKRISEHCELFRGKHEKRTFRSSPFSALFAPKTERRRSGDITGDKGFLAEIWLF